MSCERSRGQPMLCKPVYERSLSIYSGDIIVQTVPEYIASYVIRTDPDEHGIELYDMTYNRTLHVRPRIVWETMSATGDWSGYWPCIGRKAIHVLDGVDFRTFVVQAHLRFTNKQSIRNLSPSVCCSWEEYAGDRYQYPLDMEWAKFRTPEDLATALNNPFSHSCFGVLLEWLDCNTKLTRKLQDFAETMPALADVRLTGIEMLLEEPELF